MDEPQMLNDRVALVTGASRGIGRAVARRLAAMGARVAVHYHRDESAARATVAALDGRGHRTYRADAASPEQCAALVDVVAGDMGGLDILVNNAGIFAEQPIQEMDYAAWQDSWRHTLDVNLTGPANLCFLAARAMRSRGGGRIVNISSRGAFRGEPQAVAYGAAKAGLNQLSQSLAQALAPDRIFVGVVAPGFVATDMTRDILEGPRGDSIRAQSPLGRVATPEDVAEAVAFLVRPGSEFSTGTIIDVNGASYLRS